MGFYAACLVADGSPHDIADHNFINRLILWNFDGESLVATDRIGEHEQVSALAIAFRSANMDHVRLLQTAHDGVLRKHEHVAASLFHVAALCVGKAELHQLAVPTRNGQHGVVAVLWSKISQPHTASTFAMHKRTQFQVFIPQFNAIDSDEVVLELADPARAGLILPAENAENEDVLMLLMPMLLND